MNCTRCSKYLKFSSRKYCSITCQLDQQYYAYIKEWKDGQVNGNRGVKAKNISRHLVRYLKEKYCNACSICTWAEENTLTGNVPLEIDHIDGNADNNSESNLRLLCPNCHSLTPNFRNLNKGNGRDWRREKYLKGSSIIMPR